MTNTETRHIGYAEIREAMRSTLPEMQFESVEVRKIVISQEDAEYASMRAMMRGGRGRISAGTITGIYRRGGLWMSDSPDEMRDHIPFVQKVHQEGAETVLVSGLGLGMVVAGLTIVPSVRAITVIELDPDVAALVGPHLTRLVELAGKDLTIVVGDAMDPKATLPKDFKFDAAWMDIWQDLCTDNLAEMGQMGRKYSRRCGFIGYWGKELLQAQKRRESRSSYGW